MEDLTPQAIYTISESLKSQIFIYFLREHFRDILVGLLVFGGGCFYAGYNFAKGKAKDD